MIPDIINDKFPTKNLKINRNERFDTPKQDQNCCAKCSEVIRTDSIRFQDKKFCVACFTCTNCNKLLQSESKINLSSENQPICRACFEKDQTCCFACGTKIMGGSIIKALGREYHAECFCCGNCGKNLNDSKFNANRNPNGEIDDSCKVYCIECYNELFMSKCCRCGKPITDRRVVIGEDEFHEDCFICYFDGCKISLNEGAYPVIVDGNKQLFCKKHAIELSRLK